MAQQLSRRELYDLVWTEPLKKLSARFGISDVALKTSCARAEIPTPDRGYWAKKETGKETSQPILPPRSPGMSDEVLVAAGRNHWYHNWDEKELLGPLPAPPEFPEPLETVRDRIAKVIGEVKVPSKVQNWHSVLERLLRQDEVRREKQLRERYPLSWNNPLFDSLLERRRLRILNSLFFATAKLHGKPLLDRDGRNIQIAFDQNRVWIRLDRPKGSSRRQHFSSTPPESRDTTLCLSIVDGYGSEEAKASWQDDDDAKLETKLREIAIEVVLAAEVQYRDGAISQYEWRVERKAELEEEARKRKIEAERKEGERQARLLQARIDRLLRDAAAFRRAADIREYVKAVRAAIADNSCSLQELDQWSRWALAEADRIDPTIGSTFLNAIQDQSESK